MSGSRPIRLKVIPDEATSQLVLNTYTAANGQKAFDAAVQAWLKRHPNATPEEAGAAVATIICNKS
jgi:hypothetical protein